MARGKSPYKRRAKRPYKYSDLYYRWRTAVLRGDRDEADRISREYLQRFMSNQPREWQMAA
jgi:hypothetical protein